MCADTVLSDAHHLDGAERYSHLQEVLTLQLPIIQDC